MAGADTALDSRPAAAHQGVATVGGGDARCTRRDGPDGHGGLPGQARAGDARGARPGPHPDPGLLGRRHPRPRRRDPGRRPGPAAGDARRPGAARGRRRHPDRDPLQHGPSLARGAAGGDGPADPPHRRRRGRDPGADRDRDRDRDRGRDRRPGRPARHRRHPADRALPGAAGAARPHLPRARSGGSGRRGGGDPPGEGAPGGRGAAAPGSAGPGAGGGGLRPGW